MGLWVREPSTEEGEVVAEKWAANLSRGNRAIGGRLFVTDVRLVFVPNIVDRLTGQSEWSCALRDVSEVGIVGRTLEKPFSGSSRERLCVTTLDGAEEYFVVHHVGAKVSALIAARDQARS